MRLRHLPLSFSGKALPVALLVIASPHADGACNLVPIAMGGVQICDSGNSGPLSNLDGNNTLVFPTAGTGSIIGNVVFGAGNDRIEMNSGSMVGDFNLGSGPDAFTISAGTITGNVNQGFEPDDFVMRGGMLSSLTQGDGQDTFLMTGGTILNAFEDGDRAKMTGGTIGRVDMKLDNNVFELSGGTIINNLVAGFGRDTITVTGGSIGGAVSVSGGNDRVSISAGEIRGGIRTSFGNDSFDWSSGGYVRSSILMADGDDTAHLYNLNEYYLNANPLLDGGPGNDALTLDATHTTNPTRYTNWETLNLLDGSRMDLNGNLTLGDVFSGTGMMNVDSASTLTSASGSIRPFDPSGLARLKNSGTLDLSAGDATDALTIQGNYIGDKGQLLVQSVLGDDASPSDKLVVLQGVIDGSTSITVDNAGGTGALTRLNGIEVVQASNGATSTPAAFRLQNPLSAGAYQYYLFKGGATARSENSWFLRSSVLSPPLAAFAQPESPNEPELPQPPEPAPDPTPDPLPTPTPPADPAPTVPVPVPVPTPAPLQPAATLPVPAPDTPPLPDPVRGAAPIAIYRQEVPNYSVIAPTAAMLALSSLGTFHERQGEQGLLRKTGTTTAGWARLSGSDIKQQWSGTVSPRLDASLAGYQIGHDLFAWPTDSGSIQRVGFFVAHNRLKGRVEGFAGGFENSPTGRLNMQGDSVGGYWTVVSQQGNYVDTVVMVTDLDGRSRSDRGMSVETEGHVLSLSIEAGRPFAIGTDWVAEPQVQLIHQRVDMDDQNDGVSTLAFDSQPSTTGRVGVRLKGDYRAIQMPVEPFVQANLWRTMEGYDTVTFDHSERIRTRQKATTANLGAGLVSRLSQDISLYLSADYKQNLDDNDMDEVSGNLGVRMEW